MTLLEQMLAEQRKVIPERKEQDFLEKSKKQYTKFDFDAWNKGIGYVMLPGHFPIFNEEMEGLEKGLYLIAGDSNSGKSALLLEIIYRFAENPANKLFGVYVSLDDSKDKIIPRFLASHAQLSTGEVGVPIDLFSKPKRYLEALRSAGEDTDLEKIYYSYLYDDILNGGAVRRELIEQDPTNWQDYPNSIRGKTYNWLDQTREQFLIIDGTDIENGDALFEYLTILQDYVRNHFGDPDYNLIVGIDSFFDISWKSNFDTDKQYNEYTSKPKRRISDDYPRD